MGGKSGGGYDTGPMLEYGQRALDLQKEMYDDQKSIIQPWVNTGSSALDKLGMYLGLNGSNNPSSRQALVDQYIPQFTTTNTSSPSADPALMAEYARLAADTSGAGIGGKWGAKANVKNSARMAELEKGFSSPASTSTTDTAGLNAYIDKLMADQQSSAQSDPNYGSLLEGFSQDKFQADPGYQFRQDESKKAIERAAAARGEYFDPSTVSALMERSGGLADQTYNDAYNRYNNDQNNIFNRLAAVSGIGQTATGQMVGAGQNYANQAGSIYGQMGNTITAANVAKANQPSMFDNLMNVGGQVAAGWASAGFPSDIRFKEKITPIGVENGFPIYAFNYDVEANPDLPTGRFIGVMAQDVEQIMPGAVSMREDGMKIVNYDMIGLRMRELN